MELHSFSMQNANRLATVFPSGSAGRRTRRGAAWLILGWAIFWIGLVAKPCCASPADAHHAGHDAPGMAIVSHAHAGDGGAMPCCDDGPGCADAGDVIPASIAGVASPGPSKLEPAPVALLAASAGAAFSRRPIRSYRIHPAPAPPAPYHRRTSRLLI